MADDARWCLLELLQINYEILLQRQTDHPTWKARKQHNHRFDPTIGESFAQGKWCLFDASLAATRGEENRVWRSKSCPIAYWICRHICWTARSSSFSATWPSNSNPSGQATSEHSTVSISSPPERWNWKDRKGDAWNRGDSAKLQPIFLTGATCTQEGRNLADVHRLPSFK